MKLRANTALSYALRAGATGNFVLLFVESWREGNSFPISVYDWLVGSSLVLVALLAASLFLPADKSRRTGKLTDVLFGLLAVAMFVLMGLSSGVP